jgi:hypothetical protein
VIIAVGGDFFLSLIYFALMRKFHWYAAGSAARADRSVCCNGVFFDLFSRIHRGVIVPYTPLSLNIVLIAVFAYFLLPLRSYPTCKDYVQVCASKSSSTSIDCYCRRD